MFILTQSNLILEDWRLTHIVICTWVTAPRQSHPQTIFMMLQWVESKGWMPASEMLIQADLSIPFPQLPPDLGLHPHTGQWFLNFM